MLEVYGSERVIGAFFFLKKPLFIWLHWVLAAARGIFNLCPLHWECEVLATGPPGKALLGLS